MALAYLLGKGSSEALHTKINVPVLLVLSILPDVDIVFDLFTDLQLHRGPTHSILFALLIFLPLFLIYRKKAIPYFLAFISHSLIGDFIVGGQLMLLWPLSTTQYGLHELGGPYINIFSGVNVALELGLFAVATLVLYKTRDYKVFLGSDITNLVLIIPIVTVLLPSTIGFPFSESLIFSAPALALAHIFYLVLFSVAVLKTLSRLLREGLHPPRRPPDLAKAPNRSTAYSTVCSA